MINSITKVVVVLMILVAGVSSISFAQFTNDVPYQTAVPEFIDTLTGEVQNVENLEEISQWEEQTRESFPELLDDLILAVEQYSEQSLTENDLTQLKLLADNWNDLVYAYPDLLGVADLVEPILLEALEGIPELREHKVNKDIPFQNFFELYRELEIQNPWGVSAYFQLEPLPQTVRLATFAESRRDQIINGIQSQFIFYQDTTVTLDNEVVFHKLIVNNELVDYFKKTVSITLIHEVLDNLIADGADPALIAGLEDLIALIDFHLEEAKLDGLLVQAGMWEQNYQQYLLDRGVSPELVNQALALNQDTMLEQSAQTKVDLSILHPNLEQAVDNTKARIKTIALETQQDISQSKKNQSTGILNQYNETSNTISNTWLTAFFLPLFIGMLFHFVRMAISPTVNLMRRKPDIYIR